jgi:hypothetical protein
MQAQAKTPFRHISPVSFSLQHKQAAFGKDLCANFELFAV